VDVIISKNQRDDVSGSSEKRKIKTKKNTTPYLRQSASEKIRARSSSCVTTDDDDSLAKVFSSYYSDDTKQ